MQDESFASVIDAIFGKMAVRYGAAWLRQWQGVDMNLVKSDWGYELQGFAQHPEALAYAMSSLPERCPTVTQFKALCNSAPLPQFKALPTPKADERVIAENIAKQTQLKEAFAPRHDPKKWAKDFVERSERGENIRPIVLLFARQALGFAK